MAKYCVPCKSVFAQQCNERHRENMLSKENVHRHVLNDAVVDIENATRAAGNGTRRKWIVFKYVMEPYRTLLSDYNMSRLKMNKELYISKYYLQRKI